MMRSRIRRVVITTVATLVLAACSTPATPDQSQGGTTGSATGGGNERTYATTAQVLDAVKAAQSTSSLPDSVAASLTKADDAGPAGGFECKPADNPAAGKVFGQCAFGDKDGTKTMVVYGDSRAGMWAVSLAGVAAKNGWKLRAFGLAGCPVAELQFLSSTTKAPNTDCDAFHASAVAAIQALHPNLVIATSNSDQLLADGSKPTPERWQEGLASTFSKLALPGARLAMIGNMPTWANNGVRCLAAHVTAVQECSVPSADAIPNNLDAEKAATSAAGVLYVPTVQWVCADRCEPVIADTGVYANQYHFTHSYAVYLTGALAEALQPALV
jgi:hypothetical protein